LPKNTRPIGPKAIVRKIGGGVERETLEGAHCGTIQPQEGEQKSQGT